MEPLRKELPGGGVILYRAPEGPDYNRAHAMLRFHRGVLWNTELGRRILERSRAELPIEMEKLSADASYEEKLAYADVSEWKVSAVLRLISGVEGVDIKGDWSRWLQEKHYVELVTLGNELFGEPE